MTRVEKRASAYKLAVLLPFGTLLAFLLRHHLRDFAKPETVFWVLILAAVELFPVPGAQGLQLSLGFPIRLAIVILFPPATAAAIAFLGTFDRRELRGERTLLAAIFDRSQIAISALCGGLLFHTLARPNSHAAPLISAAVAAAAIDYIVNVSLVGGLIWISGSLPFRQVLSAFKLGSRSEFLVSHLGLSFVGTVIARLYLSVNLWAVAVFILPVVFGRRMFFRTLELEQATRELEDRQRVLKALSNQMATERQDERMQIAGYLHDDIAQVLFRLGLQAEMAKKRLIQGDVDAVIRDLEGIAGSKSQANDMVRALIRDLHRSPIGRTGLAEALRSFAHDEGTKFGTNVVADELVEVSLPPPIQLLIYQISREAVRNALKHAEAERIEISLRETAEGVQLRIADDGKGFDTAAPPPEGHFGSVMMRERALVAGGTYTVESELGHGSTITANFPRVWVEEGTALEQSQPQGDAQSFDPPVGSTAGPLQPPTKSKSKGRPILPPSSPPEAEDTPDRAPVEATDPEREPAGRTTTHAITRASANLAYLAPEDLAAAVGRMPNDDTRAPAPRDESVRA
jgi:signal transduction histidine kinase